MQVVNFLVRLGEDPGLRERFFQERASVMTQFGLSLAACDGLSSGDSARVRAAAGFECASLPPKVVSAPASRARR